MGVADTPLQFLGSMFIFTLGEIVVFANGYLIIESLAPKKMKGAYLGATNVSQMGVVFGPMIGGFILESMGGQALFWSMGILLCMAGGLYLMVAKLKTPHLRQR